MSKGYDPNENNNACISYNDMEDMFNKDTVEHFYAASMVSETDPQSVALGYKADATKVDKTKYPKYAAGQNCGTCALFQGIRTNTAGGCPLFAGKQVSTKAWCSAYSKKA